MRVAAFDCGTNSLRLLIADVDGAHLTEVARENHIVRLGQGVDASGRLEQDAMNRAFAVVELYAQQCREAGVERARFAATSASRDAANAEEFFEGVRSRLPGTEAGVIDGQEEAELSFLGATAALTGDGADLGRTLVVDLGGGSTEFILGTAGPGRVTRESSISVDLGSVRLTERQMRDDPRSYDTIALAAAEVDSCLDRVAEVVDMSGIDTLVGVAGTVTTLTAHALRLDSYDRPRIHGAQVDVGVMLEACEDMLHRSTEQRAELPYLSPGRADVIGAGALIWSRIVRRVAAASPGLCLRVSECDILDGIALGLAQGGQPGGERASDPA